MTLREQYVALGSPACTDFDCDATTQEAWAYYLRPWASPDGSCHTYREHAEQCCWPDDLERYGREGVMFSGTNVPPGESLPPKR